MGWGGTGLAAVWDLSVDGRPLSRTLYCQSARPGGVAGPALLPQDRGSEETGGPLLPCSVLEPEVLYGALSFPGTVVTHRRGLS